MSTSGFGETFTVIVVPSETAPVKRFQVPRALLRYGLWGGVLVALLGVAGLVDWVRLRIDSVDVHRLRAETAQQRDELATLVASMESLEGDLLRIREFERKVRVIADLPAAISQVAAPEQPAGAVEQGLPSGPSGGIEPVADLGDGPDLSLGEGPDLDREALARVRARVSELVLHAAGREDSVTDLVSSLEGKSYRLASTPSIWPTDGWVTSGYGYRLSPFTGKRKFHSGIDIAADFSTPVVAPARGKVVYVGRKGPLGQTVILDHGYGVRTSYGHTAEIFVKLGQEVERGQRIAAVGSTGRSTGPHLHYSVAVHGKSVNPSNYILE